MPSPVFRWAFIDAARAVAITLAMLSHAFLVFEVWPALPQVPLHTLRLLTRTATPVFILVFGMMLELVYLRMSRQRGRAAAAQKLLTRALLCYAVFLADAALAGLVGWRSPLQAAAAALFLEGTRLGSILQFYAVALGLAVPLLLLRERLGLVALFLPVALVWSLHPLLADLPALPYPLHYFGAFLAGAGDRFGPSILHGATFIAAGMALARALTLGREQRPLAAALLLAAVMLPALAVLLEGLDRLGGAGFVAGIVDIRQLRWRNDPAYFGFGIVAAVLLLGLCALLLGRRSLDADGLMATLGRRTLFAFGAGNGALALLPALPEGWGLAPRLAAAGLFLSVLAWAVIRHDRAAGEGGAGAYAPALGLLRRAETLCAALACRLVGLGRRLLPRRPGEAL